MNPKILFFDEPTSALTSKESEILFSKVNELKQKGIAFIFISHRLEEVFELCDSYTGGIKRWKMDCIWRYQRCRYR